VDNYCIKESDLVGVEDRCDRGVAEPTFFCGIENENDELWT
jgi:hypothetical protein